MTTSLRHHPRRSSRREEAHSSQSAIGNEKSSMDQSLLTSAATKSGSAAYLGFRRGDLRVVLAVLALLALVVLPALANTGARPARVICATNLRQIGMGYQLWSNDHDDQPPWEIRPEQGGTLHHPLG